MPSKILMLSKLNRASPYDFTITPDSTERAKIAEDLGINAVRKLRFEGQLTPLGKADWQLEATLGSTAVQPCGVTLAPVNTRIDTPLTRRYLADLPQPSGDELEMPEDDTVEPLPGEIDLHAIMVEALSLALPDFPRAPGVELGEAIYTAPGLAPMRDEDAKPLAGLAALRDKLAGNDPDPEKQG